MVRGSTKFDNCLVADNKCKGQLQAFYTYGDETPSFVIINPHPSSQTEPEGHWHTHTDVLATCDDSPCAESEGCAPATPNIGVFCFDAPLVHTVSCGGSSAPTYQVYGCSTVGILTITLTGANLDDAASVQVGNAACTVSSISATSIICTVATASVWGSAKADGGHLINVVKDGKSSSTSQINPVKLFFPKPKITQMRGSTTSKGGQTFQVTGEFFGPISSSILVSIGGIPCTNIVWKNSSSLELETPAMAGAGISKNMVVRIEAGSQFTNGPVTFSYSAPKITRIDLLAQKILIADGAAGIRMVVHGTEFADVNLNRITIQGIKLSGTLEVLATIPCLNIKRVSYEELQCDYPQGGDGATDFDVQVKVAEQISTMKLVYCSDVHIDTKLNGNDEIATAVERGQHISFTAQLRTPMATTSGVVIVRAEIVSGGVHCALNTPTGDVQRNHGNYNTPFFINVTTTEAEEPSTKRCVVKLTLESEDACYKESAKTFEQEIEITVTPKVCS